MAIAKTQFRCLLISPGDVQEEREAISDVFLRWNAHEGQAFDVIVELDRWEISTTPASGSRPQEIINQQIVDRSDFGIAIFWSRLGTPTGQFPSGSAEEITRLAISKKQVMVYFKTAPIPQTATEEFQRLKPFKEELRSSGLCEDFEDIGSLREKISHHITTAVTTLLRSQPAQSPATIAPKAPKLANLVDPFVYQMRRNVYDGLHEFLGRIMVDLKLDMQDIAKLHKLREDSEFLFGAEMAAYIREWIRYAANMKVGRGIIDDPYRGSPEQHQGWMQAYHEACYYFVQQFEPLTNIFRPYLTIPLE
jgi:hypothetical protein